LVAVLVIFPVEPGALSSRTRVLPLPISRVAGSMVAEAFGHFSVSENRWRQLECLCVLADISEAEGQIDQAREYLRRGREIARAIHARVELERIEGRLGGV